MLKVEREKESERHSDRVRVAGPLGQGGGGGGGTGATMNAAGGWDAGFHGEEGAETRRRCVSLLAPANCRGQPALAEC